MQLSASAHSRFFVSRELELYDRSAIGLSFSGGGYRAALFHAGSILRLNELGVLGRASRIASVSGGSITTGVLAMAWDKLDFGPDHVASAETIEEYFLRPILQATSKSIDVMVGLTRLLPGVSAGNALAAAYDSHFFAARKLDSIPKKPRFIWCATNLQTGGLFRFQRDYLADWRALRSTTSVVRLSQAVAASSAFPPFLSPLRLDLSKEEVTVYPDAPFDDPKLRRRPVLVDGGVYDNLGLEPIWKRCGVIFASNAGQNTAPRPSSLMFGHMVPVIYTFLNSSIDWRERVLVHLFTNKLADGLPERAGAYWTISTPADRFPAWGDGWAAEAKTLKAAADQPTRLTRFTRAQQEDAILSGYSYADAAIRSYAIKDATPPAKPPLIPSTTRSGL
jgi:NTE family protein